MFSHSEDKAAPIILKMAARERIDVDERKQLTAFIALSALRTSAAKAQGKSIKEYAREHGLSPYSLYAACTALRARAQQDNR